MKTLKPLRLLGAATFLSVSALAAMAQSTPPAPSSPPAEKPPMAKPDTAAPAPQTAPDAGTADVAESDDGAQGRASDGRQEHLIVGRQQGGDVRAVKTGPDGKVTAIQIKVGGFLGFGGKIVEVPDTKFTQKGETIQLGYTSDELSKLPEVKDAS